MPPLGRMLVGNDCDLLSFIYGPAPEAHLHLLATDPLHLGATNGLWQAVFAVSDAVLVDSSTKPDATPRAYVKRAWTPSPQELATPLRVEPRVSSLSEHDVDTALHVCITSLGPAVAFEGLCNPPGGDWSGISFRWDPNQPEYRWLTLPRVSSTGAKRPDHVFALFGHGGIPVCLSIESKEHAHSLESDIGPRLLRYTCQLFRDCPQHPPRNTRRPLDRVPRILEALPDSSCNRRRISPHEPWPIPPRAPRQPIGH